MLHVLMAVQSFCRSLGQDDFANEMQAAIETAQGLTQEMCLLHGAADNSLVELDSEQKAKFMQYSPQEILDERVLDGSLEASEPRSGLYKGIVGRVWAMVMYMENCGGLYLSFKEV
jgi:hypothetical protein